jgi:ribonuclease HII
MSTMPSVEYSPEYKYEIGLDEAGRGPMFGRLYVAAVVLPKHSFYNKDIKDSKKIHSKTKMKKLANYIKENSIAWAIEYVEHDVIDEINIRNAVIHAMHKCITTIFEKLSKLQTEPESLNSAEIKNSTILLVDGNDFKPYVMYDDEAESLVSVTHETIEGGDNLYTAISAASILAKHSRDQYIQNLCWSYPDLIDRYGIDSNMGYGTKRHMEGIEKWGITQWHRKTYGCCKTAHYSPVVKVCETDDDEYSDEE